MQVHDERSVRISPNNNHQVTIAFIRAIFLKVLRLGISITLHFDFYLDGCISIDLQTEF